MQVEKQNETANVQTFNFEGLALRAVLIDGEPWFIAMDVASLLGYSDAWSLTRRLDTDEIQNLQIGGFGNRGASIINESGLYSAIIGSQKPEAKAFKKWVTSEVLPAIRKTGEYKRPQTLEERSLALLGELTAEVQKQRAELEAARPKVETYDRVLTKEHTFGFRDLCKHLREHFPVNEADVKRVLRQKRILTPSIRLDVYSGAIDHGFAVRRAHGKWGGKERFQPRFTTKTLEMLLAELEPLTEVS